VQRGGRDDHIHYSWPFFFIKKTRYSRINSIDTSKEVTMTRQVAIVVTTLTSALDFLPLHGSLVRHTFSTHRTTRAPRAPVAAHASARMRPTMCRGALVLAALSCLAGVSKFTVVVFAGRGQQHTRRVLVLGFWGAGFRGFRRKDQGSNFEV